VRKPAPRARFLLAAGLEQVLEFLQGLQFTPAEMLWLHATGRFNKNFSTSLKTCALAAMCMRCRKAVFFPNEPILRITAPIAQAQLVETRLINLLHYQTLIASKAARMVLMAPDKLLVDFGLRRAHGAEAGLLAARASYIAVFRQRNGAGGMQFGMRSRHHGAFLRAGT